MAYWMRSELLGYTTGHWLDPHLQGVPQGLWSQLFQKGKLVDPDSVPKQFLFEKPPKSRKLPNVFGLVGNRAWAIDDAMRALLDEHSPGQCQYVPFQAFWRKDDPVKQNLYVLNILNVFDAILTRKSSIITLKNGRFAIANGQEEFTISRSVVENRHIWIPRHILHGNYVFCSDEFRDEFRRRKMRGLTIKKARESDEPWDARENYGESYDFFMSRER